MKCTNCKRKNITALLRCDCETWICSRCRTEHEKVCTFDYILHTKLKLKNELKKSPTTHNFKKI